MTKTLQKSTAAAVGQAIRSTYRSTTIRRCATFTSLAVLIGMAGTVQATTERDSITTINQAPYFGSTTAGVEGNGATNNVDISPDGRYTVFDTAANNLSKDERDNADPANALDTHRDIYMHDRQTGTTTRISFHWDTTDADKNGFADKSNTNGDNTNPSVSLDGRYVVFQSTASDLVNGQDKNKVSDIYVHDTETGKTTLVSVNFKGVAGNGASTNPQITYDGRYVVFQSDASDLVPDADSHDKDTNGKTDIFVRDLVDGKTWRVSLAPNWQESKTGDSTNPTISAWGKYVAFESTATDLVEGDNNGKKDIFLFNRNTGETTLISVAADGSPADGNSFNPDISGDGQFIAFSSDATNLVANDTNALRDVFVRDHHNNHTDLVSSTAKDKQAYFGDSDNPSISEHGNKVAFDSAATNLVPGVTSGHHVYVKDRDSRGILVASIDSAGKPGNGASKLPSISADGIFTAYESVASNLTKPETDRKLVPHYDRSDFPRDDYLYSRRPDTNGVSDAFVHHINQAPVFEPKDHYHCKNAGGQSFYLWDWVYNHDDGDHPGERQNLWYEVHYVSNPDLFGGLLNVGGQPQVTWPSHTLSYRPALNASGSSEVCLQLHDDGLTAQGGADVSRRCFTIHVDPNCDDGAGEIFNPSQFDFDLTQYLKLDILDFASKGKHSVKANVTNSGTQPVKNAAVHIALKGADQVIEADPRCEAGAYTGEYLCKVAELPVGKTSFDFSATGTGAITGVGGVGPANENVAAAKGGSLESGDASADTGSNGGGSLGWLSLLALGLVRRFRILSK